MRGVVLIAALALVSAGCGGSEDSKACDNAQEVTEQPEAAAASWALYYSVLNDRDIITEGIYYRFPYLCDTWTFNSDLLPIGMPVRHEIEDGRAVDAAGAYETAASPLSEPITTTLGIRLENGENVDIQAQIQVIAMPGTWDKASGAALKSLSDGEHTYVVHVPDYVWYLPEPEGAEDGVEYYEISYLDAAGGWVQGRMADLRSQARDELNGQLLAENEEYQAVMLEHDELHVGDDNEWTPAQDQRNDELHERKSAIEEDTWQRMTDAVDAMDFFSEDILSDVIFVLAVEIEQVDEVVLVPLED